MNKLYPDIMGVALCGGQSTRMGRDKGMLSDAGKTWAEKTLDQFKFFKLPYVLSINHLQLNEYRKIFDSTLLFPDEDIAVGPLRGILSIHKKFPENDLLVIACDLLNMKKDLIAELLSVYSQQPEYDFISYQSEDSFEPLISIYKSKALREILSSVLKGQIERFDLQTILHKGKTCSIAVKEEDKIHFKNFNYNKNFF
ncbi:MAG: molybdenum cofactor guanylyltransferase [Cytophagaceae bacterium]|nr:molybdenum cofactor guanylyltransferase [Cytophagaceae bacterium]